MPALLHGNNILEYGGGVLNYAPSSGQVVCQTPSSLSASPSQTFAILMWGSVAPAVSYDYRFREVGNVTWTTGNTTQDSIQITSLNTASDYEWQVRTNCEGGQQSGYSALDTFTTIAVSTDTEKPGTPGLPMLSSAAQTSLAFGWGMATDNIGVTSYKGHRVSDTQIQPSSNHTLGFAGFPSTGLNTDNNLVRTVYTLDTTKMEDDPNGVRLKFVVDAGYPASTPHRTELRFVNQTNSPASNTTIEYNTRFTKEIFPDLYGPVLLAQIFDPALDGPALEIEAVGANQFSSGDINKLRVVDGFGASNGQPLNYYLKDVNDLKFIVYYHSTNGKYAVKLNGDTIAEYTGLNTMPAGNTWFQFGMYPHGLHDDNNPNRADQISSGGINFSLLMHGIVKRIFPGEVDFADIETFDFNSPSDFDRPTNSVIDSGLAAEVTKRYSIIAQDAAGNKGGPSMPDSFTTLAAGNSAIPTADLVFNIPAYIGERQLSGSVLADISGNGHSIDIGGYTVQDDGITSNGNAINLTGLPVQGSSMTFAFVQRFWNTDFKRDFQWGGIQNSLYVERGSVKIRNNASGQEEASLHVEAKTQSSWWHSHIVTVRPDGSVTMLRNMGEPLSGWEETTDSSFDHTGMINGRSLTSIDMAAGKQIGQLILYSAVKQGQELEDLKAALFEKHRSPHIAPDNGVFPSTVLFSTNFDAFSDGHTPTDSEIRTSEHLFKAQGGIKVDRTTFDTHTDTLSVSKKCLKMGFTPSHKGWNNGQRMMNWTVPSSVRALDDLVMGSHVCVTDLDLINSLGAKMFPSMSIGSVPSPCEEQVMNKASAPFMVRPNAVAHGYDYYAGPDWVNGQGHGAHDPCGEHRHLYNPDGSFWKWELNRWYKIERRMKNNSVVNGVPIADGIYQVMVDGVIVQSATNIIFRDNLSVTWYQFTLEIFPGGLWEFLNNPGDIRYADFWISNGFSVAA